MVKNIGFLSYWGWGRGMCYVTLMYAKMLQEKYNVFILKQGKNEIEDDFKNVNVNITEYPDYLIDKEFFKQWIIDNKLDAVVFNEYKQWTTEPDNLVKEAKNLGCKTYGYLVAERFLTSQTKDYDRILVPTVTMERLMRMYKVRNFTYIPYSIDLNEFPNPKDVKTEENKKFTFFHPGGQLGVHLRKGTSYVIEAFEMMDNVDDCKLIITSQKPLQFNKELHPNIEIITDKLSREEFVKKFYECDAIVLPSKWETIGISTLEGLAAGKPVITTDMPPMNEFINEGVNGYLCDVSYKTYDEINVTAGIPNIMSLKQKMENITNKSLYPILSKNSRHIVEKIYDLEQNKKYFLDFLEKNLNE